MSEKELIDMYTKELRLSSVRENVQLFAEDAAREQWGHLTFLCRLLEAEAAAKRERSKATRIRMAGFPQMKYLEELERDELPAEGRALLPELETLEFIKQGAASSCTATPAPARPTSPQASASGPAWRGTPCSSPPCRGC